MIFMCFTDVPAVRSIVSECFMLFAMHASAYGLCRNLWYETFLDESHVKTCFLRFVHVGGRWGEASVLYVPCVFALLSVNVF